MPIRLAADIHRLVEVFDDVVTRRRRRHPAHRLFSRGGMFSRGEAGTAPTRGAAPGYGGRPAGSGRSRLSAHPVTPAALLVLLLLVLPLGLTGCPDGVRGGGTPPPASAAPDGDCPFIREEGGEPIGISDGSCLRLTEDEKTREVMKLVAEENRTAADEARKKNRRLRTIVYFTPLVTPENGDGLNTSLHQVRGAYLAQVTANDEESPVQIRLLLANPGWAFQHGEKVAKMIVDLVAEQDRDDGYAPGFAAVTGISQSWTQSLRAIEVLDEKNILVVGAAITGDRMSEPENYFQVSPNNSRIARRVVSEGVPGTGAVWVLKSPARNDLFSGDFAEDFAEEFGAEGREIKTIDYPAVEGAGRDAEEAATELCGGIASFGGGEAAVLYASRAVDLKTLLDATKDEAGCSDPGRRITMITSTDVPKFITSGALDPAGYHPFYFRTPVYGDLAGREGTPLGRSLKKAYETHPEWTEARDTDVSQGFDAVRFVVKLINETRPGSSYEVLLERLSSHAVQLPGATGEISLGERIRVPAEEGMPVTIVNW